MQIEIQLDEEQARKLAYIQQQTQQNVAEVLKWVVEQSYERLTQQPESPQKAALEIFQQSGFIGCIEAESEISVDYKSIVRDLIQQKFHRSHDR